MLEKATRDHSKKLLKAEIANLNAKKKLVTSISLIFDQGGGKCSQKVARGN